MNDARAAQIRVILRAGFSPGDRFSIPELTEHAGSRSGAEAIVMGLAVDDLLDQMPDRNYDGWVEWRIPESTIEEMDGVMLPSEMLADGGQLFAWNTVHGSEGFFRTCTFHRVAHRDGDHTETACGEEFHATDNAVQPDDSHVNDDKKCGRCFN